MTREIFWLTLTVILTGVMWIPYVLNRCQIRGPVSYTHLDVYKRQI